jgi:hypothetical protein
LKTNPSIRCHVPLRFWGLCIALIASTLPVAAQQGAGAQFGSRDPYPCPSRKDPVKGAPTNEQARKIVLCDQEIITESISSGKLLYLVTGLTVEVAKGRPFQMRTDAMSNIDPSQMVYPIRGGFTMWQCSALSRYGTVKGHNCNRTLSRRRRKAGMSCGPWSGLRYRWADS